MDPYVTLDEFKAWKRSGSSGMAGVNVDPDVTLEDDAVMSVALGAAAQRINDICHRDFHPVTETAEPTDVAVNSSGDGRYLFLPDFVGPVVVTGDGLEIACVVLPHDPDRPATHVKGAFGRNRDLVARATWGWPALPDPIRFVNLALGLHLYERRQMAFGIQGDADVGFIRVAGADRDVAEMLEGYVRLRALVGR
jgi:hypothetical protein